MRAVIYCRTSGSKSEASIDSQIQTCKKFIEFKGWEFTHTYKDEGVSGATTDRPAFKRMMNDANQKKFDVMCVLRLDRFGRSARDILNSVNHLETLGIGFCLVEQSIDTTTKEGIMFLTMLAGFAEFERALIMERIRCNPEIGRKLKPLDEDLMLKLRKEGYSAPKIAKQLSTSTPTIMKRLKNKGVL
jgi:site-specific DNA recombinase